MAFEVLRINQFLEALGSSAPTPGGGSTAGLAGASAASLLKMVSGLTRDGSLDEFIPDLEKIGEESLSLMNEDSLAFEGVMEAYKLPKSTVAEKTERQQHIQNALKEATITPLRTMKLGLKLLRIAIEVIEKGNPNALSDVGVAGLMAISAVKGGYYNVLINLQSLKDKELIVTLQHEAIKILHEADTIAVDLEKKTIKGIS